MVVQWMSRTFSELNTTELYKLLALRTDIFVVEQHCPYPELDFKDTQQDVYHILGYEKHQLVAYARLLSPEVMGSNSVYIGRVAVLEKERSKGIGFALVAECLKKCNEYWPEQSIQISAQFHLQDFYAQLGFSTISEKYMEDGIEHIEMAYQNT